MSKTSVSDATGIRNHLHSAYGLKKVFANSNKMCTFAVVNINDMETAVAYTNDTRTTRLPRIKKAKKVVSDIPEGYMSLEQFEKELVEAVVKKL